MVCVLLLKVFQQIFGYDRCYPKGEEIDILQIGRFFEITIWSSVVADVAVQPVTSLIHVFK